MPLTKKTLGEWSQDFLRCRAYGHHWMPNKVLRVPGGFDSYEICYSCGSERLRLYDNRGHIQQTRLKYEKGYLAPKGTGQLDADDRGKIRLAVLMEKLMA